MDKIVIYGEIIGEISEKAECTNPIHGICNWSFTESVQPDSLGKFQIETAAKEFMFIKIRTSYTEQGTLIVEPGTIYNVRFNLNDKENIFSITGKSSAIQKTYNKFPKPEHIQFAAREFLRDTIATKIKETIEQRKTAEIAEFKKLYSDKLVSRKLFDMVKTDTTCYYDAVLATTAWIKNLMTIQGRDQVFPKEFEDLWKGAFDHPLFPNPEIVKSQWFNFYAESFITLKVFMYEQIKNLIPNCGKYLIEEVQ